MTLCALVCVCMKVESDDLDLKSPPPLYVRLKSSKWLRPVSQSGKTDEVRSKDVTVVGFPDRVVLEEALPIFSYYLSFSSYL